jgi:predicted nucleotidyltransferase
MDYFLLGSLNYQLQEKLGIPVDTVLEEGLPKEDLAQIKRERVLLYESRRS